MEEQGNVFEELAICCELGLPALSAAKVYLSGIRSRKASMELAKILSNNNFEFETSSFSNIQNFIKENQEMILREEISPFTKDWVILSSNAKTSKENQKFHEFSVTFSDIKSPFPKYLFLKEFSGKFFLVNFDYSFKQEIKKLDSHLEKLANRNDLYFFYEEKVWNILSRKNPK
jgi:hypothetical protein